MAYYYPRGQKLYVGFQDAHGKRRQKATDFVVGEEAQAEALCRSIQRRVEEQTRPTNTEAELTLEAHGERWIGRRSKSGLRAWRDEANHLRRHIFPKLGSLHLHDVRPAERHADAATRVWGRCAV